MNSRKPEDWIDTAERLGDQLTKGLEKVGDQVQKALESLDDMSRNHFGPAPGEQDERPDPKNGVPIETLLRGDVFEEDGELFMRLGTIPGLPGSDDVYVVNLRNGDVRRFARGTQVEVVDARVLVKEKPSKA